jgi:hypothetical protein
MASFFRKLFSAISPFPEYSDFIATLELLRGHGLEIIEGSTAAFAEPYDRYVKSQKSLQELAKIATQAHDQCHAMRHLFMAVASLTTDLDPLRQRNVEYQNRLTDLKTAKTTAAKSKAEADSTKAAYDKAKARGNTSDAAKCEQRADIASARSEQDKQSEVDAEASFAQFHSVYRVDWVDTFASTIDGVIAAKLEELKALEPVADAIIEISGEFKDFEDPSLKRLSDRLKELEAVVVE